MAHKYYEPLTDEERTEVLDIILTVPGVSEIVGTIRVALAAQGEQENWDYGLMDQHGHDTKPVVGIKIFDNPKLVDEMRELRDWLEGQDGNYEAVGRVGIWYAKKEKGD